MRTIARWLALGIMALALAAGPIQAPEPAAEILWRPDPPLQGSLVLLVVKPATADSALTVSGVLAEEPLHFESDGRGGFVALGGVPLAAGDSIVMQVTIDRPNEAADTIVTPLPVARRRVSRERLRTPPEFTRPPDSALLARLARERALVNDVLQRVHLTPRLWSQPFARPRPGRARSAFGTEREFNDAVESRHLGVDYAGRRGAPVRAANRGVVALAAELYYAGRTIFLDHGAGLLTGYLHLERSLVAPGDTVERGQVIGHVGTTGRVTGPHLHWLARYGAVDVDPADLLTLDLTPLLGVATPPGATGQPDTTDHSAERR